MKKYIPLFEDYSLGDYPPGAANDPDAPYNQSTEETDFDPEHFTVSLIEPFNEKKLISVALSDDAGNNKVIEISFVDLFNIIKEYNDEFAEGDAIISVDRTQVDIKGKKVDKFIVTTENGASTELFTDDYMLDDYIKTVL